MRSNMFYAGGEVKRLSLVVDLRNPIYALRLPSSTNLSTPSPLEFVPTGRDTQSPPYGRLYAYPRYPGDKEDHGYRAHP